MPFCLYGDKKAYKAGRSYRGRDISVVEITNPTPSEIVSLAKLSAYKPTIFITGRQHANEVSSRSHILRFGELLVTDAAYKDILKKVNVVLHPVENPDGAQMAYDLQKLTPTHMLSAGTEAPDETAQSEWLNLVSKAGFSYLMASVKYLRDGHYTVHRIEEDATRDAVSLTTVRIRPVMPGKTQPQRQTTATVGK